MKKIKVELCCGFNGFSPTDRNRFVQFPDETPEELIERVTNVLFENIEQLDASAGNG